MSVLPYCSRARTPAQTKIPYIPGLSNIFVYPISQLPLESQQRVMEHDEVVCSSPGEFDPHNPALYFGRLYLTATVPQLLGLLEQYRSKDKDLGPMMEFDNNGEYLSWAAIRERLPLKVECHFQQENHEMASLTVKEIQQRLGCTGGLIEEDRAFIEQSALMTFSPPDPDCRRGYEYVHGTHTYLGTVPI